MLCRLTWHIVHVVVFGGRQLELVQPHPRQSGLAVVEFRELHHLEVRIFAPPENGRVVGRFLRDRHQQGNKGWGGEAWRYEGCGSLVS